MGAAQFPLANHRDRDIWFFTPLFWHRDRFSEPHLRRSPDCLPCGRSGGLHHPTSLSFLVAELYFRSMRLNPLELNRVSRIGEGTNEFAEVDGRRVFTRRASWSCVRCGRRGGFRRESGAGMREEHMLRVKLMRRADRTAERVTASDCGHTSPAVCASYGSSMPRLP